MRSLSRLALLGLSLVLLPNTAMAADQNTYRAGSPYLKTAAANFSQCAQQCQGDAACRGWNFVRPNPGAASGICEFNARAATPMASPISISGTVTTSVDPLMSRAVHAGTNTIRVGTPTMAAPKPAAVTRRNGRIIKRQPLPRQTRAVRPTSHTRPAPQKPNVRAPRVYGGQAAKATPQARSQATAQKLTPQQEYYRQQYLAKKRQQQQIQARQQAALQRPGPLQRPQVQRPQMQRQTPQGQANMNAPRPPMPPQVRAAQAAPNMMPPAGPPPLYGSLHDDLTKNMTAVPRPKTAPDSPSNPNAPLSTSRARPSKPVQSAPLKKPALPALAGG